MADEIDNEEEPGEDYAEEAEPDVLLDVPRLAVEEISLDVESLRARVSLQAEVLDLLKLGVGVDAELTGLHLEIKGVEAEVLLKARLDNVADIINRVLTTVDHNPDIVARAAGAALPSQDGGAEPDAVEGGTDVAGDAVEGVGKVLDTSGHLVDKVLGGGGEAPKTARHKRVRGRDEQPP
ncbi:hypothetical protein [Amycolatopsis pithecellobii]|uniref:Uncharacterized protein n=1 Tax=Amycolatopsis pithecellobii TaxID=664692 RepID=A0A6N7Z151_9PSEU|nr:hypothetical protein [Amycolatopsis pithecellobii]MTD55103.1 hypothetical protein [Amycolatopsis pithecellobii]